jgi:hypothetical protein
MNTPIITNTNTPSTFGSDVSGKDDARSIQQDINLLNDDETPEVKKEEKHETPPKEKDDETPEETDNDEELEVEDEDSDESEESDDELEPEETEESRLRPSIKTMMKDFPELDKILKKYPQLRDAYYREGKLSAFFPTVEDAEEAATKAESLDTFSQFLMDGSSKELLEAVGQNPESLKNFVTNFLPTLSEYNSDLFYEVSVPIVDTAIRNLYKRGQKLGNDNPKEANNMMAAAKIMAHFLHGEYEIPEAKPVSKDTQLDSERKKFNEEKLSREKEIYEEFSTKVDDRSNKLMTKYVMEGLDPQNSLSDFTKSKIVEDVIEKIGRELQNDRAHMKLMDKYWKNARNERFSNQSAERILTAYLSRAKRLIPEIRAKVKAEATGVRKASGPTNGKRKTEVTGGSRSPQRSSNPNIPAKPDRKFWKENSDRAILDS